MRLFLACCLCLMTVALHAQISISGKVFNEKGDVVSFATVSVVNPHTSAVLDYDLVNDEGQFTVDFKSDLPEVILRVSAINYKVETKIIAAKSQEVVINLISESTILEEVFVKASIITQYKDTIFFDLNSFAGENDRVLEDVIKKLPGIEVAATGEISYQGKAINKFYVEGKDLMQGSYNMITKAMPNMHVSKLEVIENHQPIKMLEGVESSNSPAINIRLKSNISFSGSGKIGVGASPFLWNASVTPMLFSKDLQYLVNYDANNTGNELASKLLQFSSSSYFDTTSYTVHTGSTLNIANTSLPSVDRSRYLFNQSHLASVNFLTNLTSDLELNTNIYYYNDEVKGEGSEYTEITNLDSNTGTIRFGRKSEANYFNETFKSVFTFTKNKKENYLKDYITVYLTRKKNRGILYQNNAPINQSVLSPSYSIQNSFSTLIRVGDKKFANFKSIIDFTNDRQDYDVETNNNLAFKDSRLDEYNILAQSYLSASFYTKNELSMSWKYNKWLFTEEYGIGYKNTKFITDLDGVTNDYWESIEGNYHNNLRYGNLTNTLSTRVEYKTRVFDFSFLAPIELNAIRLTDKIGINNAEKNVFTFLPNISSSYKITSKLTLRGGGYISKSFTPLEQLYAHYIFSGLNFTAYQSKIEEQKSYVPWFRVEYKNPFNGLFTNGSFSYKKSENDILLGTSIDDNGLQVIKALPIFNTSDSYSYNLNLGKFFSKLSTNIKGSYQSSDVKTMMLLNDNISQVKLLSTRYGFEITNTHFNWLNFEYNINYIMDERNDFTTKTYAYNTIHKLRFDITPVKSHSFIWKLDYEDKVFNHQKFSNKFMDLSYRYRWSAKKIDFYLNWNNLLNTKEYNQVIINNIQTSATTYKLRPSQVLASVRFNF